MKAVIINPDGTIEERPLDKPLTLTEMQAIVGGDIEVVPPSPLLTARGETMLVNENGGGLELPFNKAASNVAFCYVVGVALVIDYPLE